MSTEDKKLQLFESIKVQDLEKMRGLIKEGVNLNELDEYGLTPLHFAVISKFPEGVKLLLESGSQVNSLSSHHTTPLHHAAKGGLIECVQVLLEHNADVMVRDESTTPFGYAVKKGHFEVAHALIAAAEKQGGLDMKLNLLNMEDTKGEVPLSLAVSIGNMKFISELVSAGASLVKGPPGSDPTVNILEGIKFNAPQEILDAGDDNNASVTSEFVKQIAALHEEGSAAASAVKTDFVLKAKKEGDEEMSDGEDSIAVHKIILAARSSRFAALLKEKPDLTEEVVEGVSRKHLQNVVDWVYKNTVADCSFTDTLMTYKAALHLFNENDAVEEATPLFVLADRLAREFNAATLLEAWDTVWDPAYKDHKTTKLLRQHALFFALNKLKGAAEEKDMLKSMKKTTPTLLGETLSMLELYTPPKDDQAAPSALPAQAADTGAGAAAGCTRQVFLTISVQCPQDLKDDIAKSDEQLGNAILNRVMTPGHLSLARKIVTSIVKNQNSRWFRIPVDEARDGAPSYYTIIKHPMDLQSLRAKYLDRKPLVTTAVIADFVNDGRTIWQNAMIYNAANSPVFLAAHKLAKTWENLVRSSQWANAPEISTPQGMKRPAGSTVRSPASQRPSRASPSTPMPASASAAASAAIPAAAAATSSSSASAPLSPKEVEDLMARIMAIQTAGDNDALMELVKIANADPGSGEVELDFTKLGNDVLRRMEAYVNKYEATKGQKK